MSKEAKETWETSIIFAAYAKKPLWRTLASPISGILLALSFPKPEIWFLVFLAPAPLLWAIRASSRPRQAAWYGFIAGGVFFGLHLMWVRVIGEVPYFALVLFQGIYIGVFGYAAYWLLRAPLGWLSTAAAWSLIEWMRSLGMFGSCWGDLAVTFYKSPFFLKLLPSMGQFLAGGIPVISSATLLEALAGRFKPLLSFSLLLAVMNFLSPLAILHSPSTRSAYSLGLRALILQTGDEMLKAEAMISNLPQRDSWPCLAVMGEAVFSESPEKRLHSDPWSFPAFQGGTNWLLAGQTVLTEDGRRLNAGVLYFPSGFPAGYYAKTRPLPFAEWLPHPFFDSVVQSYAPGMQYFAIGDRLRPLPLAMLPSNATPREIKKALLEPARCARVGVLICFESSLPQLSYALCSQGASFLVVLSSNQTIQATAATRQHLAHDVVRAAECNVSVLRCANTGISAAISPKGQILGQLEVGSVDYIALDQVEMPDGITVAVKYHFGLLGIAVLLVLLSLASQFKLHTRASLKQSQESPR